MSFASPSILTDRVFAAVFARRERLDAAEWAERYRRVVGGATDGAWDFSRTPYLRGVCLAYSDPAVRRVTVMKAEQVGGTEAMLNCLMWGIDQMPGGTLWVYPNDEVARKVNKDRMMPSLRACPQIAERIGPHRGDMGNLELRMKDGSVVYYTGSNSDANIEIFSFRRVFVDELDRCSDGIMGKVRGRTANWRDGKIYDNGTPTFEGLGIEASYRASDRCRWWTPCPDCGHWHVRDDFDRVSWPMEEGKPLSADPAEVERLACYSCPACEHKINPREHAMTSLRGVWLPVGWGVDEWGGAPNSKSQIANSKSEGEGTEASRHRGIEAQDSGLRTQDSLDALVPSCLDASVPAASPQDSGLRTQDLLPAWCLAQIPDGVLPVWVGGMFEGEQLPEVAPPPSTHAGFHIAGEMSTIVANSFGNVAREFVESKGHPGVEWLNRRRGCPWRANAKRIETAELRRLCVPVAEGGYRLGRCPRGTLALTFAADIQAREAYCEVRGWGAGGRQSALVWCEVVPIDAEAGRFERLIALMGMRFAMMEDPAQTLGLGAAAIDSGYFTEQIYTLVATLRGLGYGNIWPVKGDGGNALAQPIVETRIDLSTKVGGHRGGGLTLLRLKVNYWKQATMGRIHGEEEMLAAGAGVGVGEGGGGVTDPSAWERRFMLPEDAPDEYLLQLTSEERVLKFVSGQPVHAFEPRRGFANRNHYWDACGYNLAVAKRAGVDHLGAAPAQTRPAVPAEEVRRERPGILGRAGRGSLDRRRS